ncbi:MAG: hypothetical protein UDK36_05305 [Bacteroidaceae bacterium]|nr:hypothetical protein [Bacteroidaceae bacterium]
MKTFLTLLFMMGLSPFTVHFQAKPAKDIVNSPFAIHDVDPTTNTRGPRRSRQRKIESVEIFYESEHLRIVLPYAGSNLAWKIDDHTGHSVMSSSCEASSEEVFVHVSSLEPGSYILYVYFGGISTAFSFVVD